MKFTVFPNLQLNPDTRPNPSMQLLIEALTQNGVKVVNPPAKNPLLSILKPSAQGDVLILNWLEDVIFSKYGWLQWTVAFFLVYWLQLSGKKMIYMLHNKTSHIERHHRATEILRRLIIRKSAFILTYAREGVDFMRQQYPKAADKTFYINHPTVDRLSMCKHPDAASRKYDILIWGTISKYKGVTDFIRFIRDNNVNDLKVCILGRCPSAELYNEIQSTKTDNIDFIDKGLPFEELAHYIDDARFVLVPFQTKTLLGSGTLADSLSFGAKVIGPDAGSFSDYPGKEPRIKVYTFKQFSEIPQIVKQHADDNVDIDQYKSFLDQYTWYNYAGQIISKCKEH
jgi:beta-1,4-mannosyltransferase